MASRCIELFLLGEISRARELLAEAEPRARALGDRRRLGEILDKLGDRTNVMGERDRAIVYFRQALDIAAELGDVGLEVFTKFHMGLARHFMGDYRQAVALFRENITVLTGDLVRERFGRAVAAGILSHSWLARSLAELGEFAAAIRIAEEVLQVAESTESPFAVAQACLSVGIARVARGAAAEAIAPLERGLTLCELRELYGLAPVTASYLAYAYALSGRLDDSLRLLERKPEPARVAGGQPRRLILLGEIRLLAGGNAESSRLVQQALVESREGRQHGDEGRALRLLGEIAARRDPPDALVAEAHYRQALAIAEEREMRPFVAHCHFGLGKLSRRTGKPQQAREQLDTAIAMYRDMGMTYWLEKAEAEQKA